MGDLQELENYMGVHGNGLGHSAAALAMLPVNVTFRSERFDAGDGISCGFLAFAPIALLSIRWNRRWAAFALLLSVCALTWFYTAQQARYFTYGFAMVAVLAGFGVERAMTFRSRVASILALLLLGVSTFYGFASEVSLNKDRLLAFVSPARGESRWLNSTPYIRAYDYLNNSADVTRVLILNPAVPPFYLNQSYFKPVGSHGERPYAESMGIRTEQDALKHLDDLRISHIFDVTWPPIEVQTEFGKPGETNFLVVPSSRFKVVFERSDVRIYEVVR
jgi:hypothetical protein